MLGKFAGTRLRDSYVATRKGGLWEPDGLLRTLGANPRYRCQFALNGWGEQKMAGSGL